MAFLILGLALLGMKAAEFGPVAAWPWWLVLAPFGLAVLWWGFADSTGLTQRRAIDKMDKRKADRRQRDMENLGLGTGRAGKGKRAGSAAPPGGNRRDPPP